MIIINYSELDINTLKDILNKNIMFIQDNIDRSSIKVLGSDIKKVYELLTSNDIDLICNCLYEMDDIINSILINIDNELKSYIDLGIVSDYQKRIDIMEKIIKISDIINFDEGNKGYFISKLKIIYNNIDGDNL